MLFRNPWKISSRSSPKMWPCDSTSCALSFPRLKGLWTKLNRSPFLPEKFRSFNSIVNELVRNLTTILSTDSTDSKNKIVSYGFAWIQYPVFDNFIWNYHSVARMPAHWQCNTRYQKSSREMLLFFVTSILTVFIESWKTMEILISVRNFKLLSWSSEGIFQSFPNAIHILLPREVFFSKRRGRVYL